MESEVIFASQLLKKTLYNTRVGATETSVFNKY